MGGAGHSLSCTPLDPGRIHVLEGWQISSSRRHGRVNYTLQSAFFLGRGSSVADCDGGGEDGLKYGCIEVTHYCDWQVELPQLLQRVYPLLGFLVRELMLPLEILCDDGAKETEVFHSVG